MKTSSSNLDILKIVEVPCAHLYFIDPRIVIVEIKENESLGKEEVIPIIKAIESQYNTLNEVHYISNRIEIYSLKPTELAQLKPEINKFKSYSVVMYGSSGQTNLDFERLFLKKSILSFDSLELAIKAAIKFDQSDNDSSYVA